MKKIGILGLGLMGGSLFKALPSAVALGVDWEERIDEIDLLIIATPISAILELGAKIAKRPRSQKLLVLDIGSVKGEITASFERWTSEKVEFIASHPMAGKAKSGFEESESSLFVGASWVICPHGKNTEEALLSIEQLIRRLGAHPKRMSAKEHDKKAAIVSHVPYLLSKALFDLGQESLDMAGPGFRSMTRIAKDNPELHREIARHNSEEMVHFLKSYIHLLEKRCSEIQRI